MSAQTPATLLLCAVHGKDHFKHCRKCRRAKCVRCAAFDDTGRCRLCRLQFESDEYRLEHIGLE